MRTLRSSPIVSTSPTFTPCPGAISRTPLMRTWPASTSAAALVRAFTTRACHNHLSRRWRSTPHQSSSLFERVFYTRTGTRSLENALAILAVGGELLFQRRQFGKGRIGVDRTLAFARGRAGGVLPVRGPAVASAFIAAAIVAPAREFALALVRIPAF